MILTATLLPCCSRSFASQTSPSAPLPRSRFKRYRPRSSGFAMATDRRGNATRLPPSASFGRRVVGTLRYPRISTPTYAVFMAQKRIHLIVRGRVQGVYFRAAAQREAKRLGITGWVRNRPDGSVELCAEGDED